MSKDNGHKTNQWSRLNKGDKACLILLILEIIILIVGCVLYDRNVLQFPRAVALAFGIIMILTGIRGSKIVERLTSTDDEKESSGD